MARTVNAETLALSKKLEGLRLKAYPDPGSRDGKPVTIGYGTTRISGKAVTLGTTITEAQAEKYHMADLEAVTAAIERLVKVPLNDNQLGALTLFANNMGTGALQKSTLLKKLNAGNYDAVPSKLAKWRFNDGKVMQGLVNRRAAEAGLWAKGSFAASNTVRGTDDAGELGGRQLTGAVGLASGNGRVQIALAFVLVLAAIVAAVLIIRKRAQ